MKRANKVRRAIDVIEDERRRVQARLVALNYELDKLQFAKAILDDLIEKSGEAK